MKKISLSILILGIIGMIFITIICINDSQAADIIVGVIIQIFFSTLFVAGYLGYCLQSRDK